MIKEINTLTITKIKIRSTSQFTEYVLKKRFNFSTYLKSYKNLTKSENKKFLIFLCAIKLFITMDQRTQYQSRKCIENFINDYIEYFVKYIKIYYFYLLYNIKISNLFLLSFSCRKMYNILTQNTPKCNTSFCRREA